MTIAIEIQRAEHHHIPDLHALETACFAEPWSPKSFRYIFSHHVEATAGLAVIALLATVDEDIVGYALFQGVFEDWELFRLAVLPAYRRQGVAKRLLSQGLEYAKANGCTIMRLEARRKNSPARYLYEGFGFIEYAVRSKYYPNGDDAILYAREL